MASLQQSSSFFFLLTITFFFLASPVFCKPKLETLIDRICADKGVEDYDFCQTVLRNHVTSSATDIHGLTKLTIRRTFSLANYIYTSILYLLQLPTDPSTKKELQKCRDGYGLLISHFDLATHLFRKHEYQDAYDAERESVWGLQQCKIDIKIPRYPKSPVIKPNKHTRTLLAMSLASFKLLLQTNN